MPRSPRRSITQRIEWALAQVDLREFAQRRSERLSGGQRQRVAIARMLARDVDLVIADEPTANLDPELVGETVHLLRRLAERVPVIVVTDDARVAEQCDRTIVLQATASTAPAEAAPAPTARALPRGVSLHVRSSLLLAALIVALVVLGSGGASLAWHSAQSPRSGSSRTATSRTLIVPSPTPTSSGTTPQGFKLVSDQSGEWVYQPQSDWWIAFSCVPETDPHGSLAVRVWGGTSGQPVDFGLFPCNGVSQMFAVGSDNNRVDLCEDSDFGVPATPLPGYSGSGTLCQVGAVKWTLITPIQVQSGPFGWG